MKKVFPILVLAFSQLSYGATWYASSSGSSTDGTRSNPWSIERAVGKTANTSLQPGDTVILLSGGTFTCTDSNTIYQVGRCLEFKKSGTPSAKITYKAETLWGFSFDGCILLSSASNVVLYGLRTTYSGATNRIRNDLYTHPPGVYDVMPGNEILHNLIENMGHPGISSWKGTLGKTISGNIIRFTGINDYTQSYAGANRGSGMYLQNADDSSEALIEGNISYANYTTGMKAYGNTDIWGFQFLNNICTECQEAGIFYHLDNYGSTGVSVHTNFLWNTGTAVRLGYPLGNGGHSGASVIGNYCVEESAGARPLYQADGWTGSTWTYNTAVQLSDRYVWQMEVSGETSGDITSHTLNHNSYYGVNAGGIGSGPFLVKDVSRSLAQWQSDTTQDADASYTYGTPASNSIYAFRPSSDLNFVHVAVFNWEQLSSTTVDLSSYFANGDRLKIYDAQNIPTACSTIRYDGSTPVSLPLNLTDKATMLGSFTDPAYTWSGFNAKFRAFVIHKDPATALASATTLHVGTLK